MRALAAPSAGRATAVRQEVEVVMADARRTIPSPADLDEAVQLGADVLQRLGPLAETEIPAPPRPVALAQ